LQLGDPQHRRIASNYGAPTGIPLESDRPRRSAARGPTIGHGP
jgi:hypothetical protein